MTDENPEPSFHVTIEVSVELKKSELWPDGDGPTDPTEDDVRALIKKEGGVVEILREWNLEDDIKLSVQKKKTPPAMSAHELAVLKLESAKRLVAKAEKAVEWARETKLGDSVPCALDMLLNDLKEAKQREAEAEAAVVVELAAMMAVTP